jgi:hypothetical protein
MADFATARNTEAAPESGEDVAKQGMPDTFPFAA